MPSLRRPCWSQRRLLLPLLVLAAGCGEDADAPEDERSAGPTRLVVTRADGSEVILDEVTATCGPSDAHPGTEVVHLRGTADGTRLEGEIVPGDVEGGRSFELPMETGDQETGPKNLYLFVGGPPDLETSTSQEESSGSLKVERASCDPVAVELTVDATLASEYHDGVPVDVEGRIVFPAPAG